MKELNTNPNAGMAWQLWLDGASDLVKVWDMPPNPCDSDQWRRQRNALSRCPSFFGVQVGEPEARHVLTHGWPQGAAMVNKLASEMKEQLPPPKSRRRNRKWREDGDELNHDRVRLGYDTCWRSMHRELKSACGLIELVQCWGSGCGATTDALQWSGATALALTDLLERADYSVELALVAAMSHGPSVVRVDLKQMGQLLDIEALAAVAVYPPAWRLYGLCAFQQSPHGSGGDFDSHPHFSATQIASGLYYGLSANANGMWNYRPNVMTLLVPEAHTEQQAKSNILEALKALGELVGDPSSEHKTQTERES